MLYSDKLKMEMENARLRQKRALKLLGRDAAKDPESKRHKKLYKRLGAEEKELAAKSSLLASLKRGRDREW